MAFFQGSPLPSVTTTQDKQQTAPGYYTDYLTKLSETGQQALTRTPEQGVAGYDPLQTTGYGQYEGAAGAYKPGLEAAASTANRAASGIDLNRIGALMDPYQRQVVDEMARLSQQNVQRNLLPTMKAGFVGSGGLGSQRYAGALGQSLADVQSNLTGQQYGALSAGYQNALKAALDEQQLANQAAQTQMQIAGKEQELGLTGAGALTKAGAERQKYQQSLLDYPLSQATNVSQLLRGYNYPLGETTKTVAPGQQGQFGQSTAQNIAGILSLVGGAQTGGVGADGKPLSNAALAGSGAQAIYNAVKGLFSKDKPISGEQFIADWNPYFFDENKEVPFN